MWSKLPELLINGASLYLVGKEIMDQSANNSHWKEMYEAARQELNDIKTEAKSDKESLITMHNSFMEVMAQVHDIERSRSEIYRAYLSLVDQVEEFGLRVNENNEIIGPEEEDELQALLNDDEEETL